MIPTLSIAVRIICILVCLAVIAFTYFLINKRSRKLETGLLGALGYGFVGYIWQYIFYMFTGLAIVKGFQMMGNSKSVVLLAGLCASLVSTIFAVMSIYWGLYLTNQKQQSIYRSVVVGLGFVLGKIALEIVYTYGTSVFTAIQINQNGLDSKNAFQVSVVNTTIGSLIGGTYNCLLMVVIILTMSLIMGKYYLEKKRGEMLIVGGCIYEAVSLLSMVVKQSFPTAAANTILYVLLTVIAFFAFVILYHWFRTGEVEVDPIRLLKKKNA